MSNKLKCDAHDRRIVATETAFLHKTGDNSTCDSRTATIGSQTFSVGNVQSLSMANSVKNHPHSEEAWNESEGVIDGIDLTRVVEVTVEEV